MKARFQLAAMRFGPNRLLVAALKAGRGRAAGHAGWRRLSASSIAGYRIVPPRRTFSLMPGLLSDLTMEVPMGFGRGVLFWLLGVPIPIIILLALFWHH
jgi:hypothetical protein